MGASKIKGTAIKAMCTSTKKAAGNMCAGFYCGVTKEDIAAELNTSGAKCSMATPESICSGELPKIVADCSRSTKMMLQYIAEPDFEKLRKPVADCIYKTDPELKETAPMECLDCFLDAAICAGNGCFDKCIVGDTPDCEKCRMEKGCNQMVPTCGGLPTPF